MKSVHENKKGKHTARLGVSRQLIEEQIRILVFQPLIAAKDFLKVIKSSQQSE